MSPVFSTVPLPMEMPESKTVNISPELMTSPFALI